MNTNTKALNEVLEILKENDIKVELKNYRELQTHNGYHMIGDIYVNGKKALTCEDGGFGGPLDIKQHLTKKQFEKGEKNKYAQLLIDVFEDKNILKNKVINTIFNITDKEGNKSILYFDLDSLFYQLAEKYLEDKEYKKLSAKKILYRPVEENEKLLENGQYYSIDIKNIFKNNKFKHTKDIPLEVKQDIIKKICKQLNTNSIYIFSSFLDWKNEDLNFKLI